MLKDGFSGTRVRISSWLPLLTGSLFQPSHGSSWSEWICLETMRLQIKIETWWQNFFVPLRFRKWRVSCYERLSNNRVNIMLMLIRCNLLMFSSRASIHWLALNTEWSRGWWECEFFQAISHKPNYWMNTNGSDESVRSVSSSSH